MKVIIIGGGAAGMLAAYQAAKCGNDVSLYEKNEKLGNIKGLKVLDALDSLNKYSEEVRDKGADIIIA